MGIMLLLHRLGRAGQRDERHRPTTSSDRARNDRGVLRPLHARTAPRAEFGQAADSLVASRDKVLRAAPRPISATATRSISGQSGRRASSDLRCARLLPGPNVHSSVAFAQAWRKLRSHVICVGQFVVARHRPRRRSYLMSDLSSSASATGAPSPILSGLERPHDSG